MKSNNKTFLVLSTIMVMGLTVVILGVHGIGIVVGIGGLLGLLFLNIFEYVQTTVKKE